VATRIDDRTARGTPRMQLKTVAFDAFGQAVTIAKPE
jgi:hypothetical protein